MTASSVKAGEAYVIISAKLDQLRADLKKGKSELSGWGTSLSGIGAAIGGAMAAAVAGGLAIAKHFADAGSQINDMAARTGLATGQLQEMKFAAGQTGAGLEDVERAARHFAKEGGNVKEFEAVGQAIASIVDPSQRAKVALDMFGKSGTKLIPMFAELKSLKEASAAVGPILTDAEVRTADALGDSFSALKESVSRAMNQIAVSFGPQLKSVLDTMVGMIASLAEAVKNANPFGQGGDLLDQLAEWDRKLLSGDWGDWRKRGQAGSQSFSQAGGGMDDDTAEETRSKARAASSTDQIIRSIERANAARISLIQQFETPAERFLRRQEEINKALAELNKNRVMGFVDQGSAASQRGGLETAMRRLRAEEAQRLADLFRPMEQQIPAKLQAMFSSQGTFSSSAAGHLANAGESIEAKKIEESIKVLRNIEKNTAKNTGPRFT